MSGSKQGKLGLVAVAVLSIWALVAAAAAQANTVTVGSVLPTTFTSAPFGPQPQTLFNTALPEKGANLASPVSGTIIRWRVQGAKGGPFFLRVLRPNGAGAFTAMGTSSAATPSGAGLQTFTANLPVKAGDLIGIDPTSASDEIGFASQAGAALASIFPTPFDGTTVAPSGAKSGEEIELSAEVQATPAITSISPSAGSVVGGAEVKITGTSFTGASAVKFGNLAATSFKVESDTAMTVTAPKSTKVGGVDLTVTTIGGVSPLVRADRFTYTGCAVPKLNGKKLGRAKQLLAGAGCKLGKVTKRHGVTAKTGKVKQQGPKAGKVLPKGTKVKVTLG